MALFVCENWIGFEPIVPAQARLTTGMTAREGAGGQEALIHNLICPPSIGLQLE